MSVPIVILFHSACTLPPWTQIGVFYQQLRRLVSKETQKKLGWVATLLMVVSDTTMQMMYFLHIVFEDTSGVFVELILLLPTSVKTSEIQSQPAQIYILKT